MSSSFPVILNWISRRNLRIFFSCFLFCRCTITVLFKCITAHYKLLQNYFLCQILKIKWKACVFVIYSTDQALKVLLSFFGSHPCFPRDYSKTATWSFIRTHLVEKEWGRWGPRRGESVERHNLEAFTLHPISGFFESYAQIWHLCKVMKLHLIKKRHLKQYNVIAQNIFSCCFRRLSEQRESSFLLLLSHSSMKSHST